MRKRYTILYILIAIISIVSTTSLNNATNVYNTSVSALSYQDKVSLEFTFEPAIGINLSNSVIRIKDLAPGTSASSNVISINVNTNNITGYVLSATVGNGSTYTDNRLISSVLDNDNQPVAAFDSIASTLEGVSSLTTPNTWGYTIDNGTTYNGLVYGTNTVLTSTTNNSDSKTTTFGIGAYADTTQATGDYSNIIQFSVVANPTPVTFSDAFRAEDKHQYHGYYKMQDMTSTICEMVDYGIETRLIDVRDDNVYWVAKLKDNHCWMTQNLDFNIDSTKTYTYYDTDLGHTTNDLSAEWGANVSSAIAIVDFTTNTASGWSNKPYSPSWADGGDNYLYSGSTLYTSFESCTNAGHSSVGCTHYHVGNYYNWSAAVATNNTAEYQDNYYVMPNSICPAGWRLPNGLTSNNDATILMSDFNALLNAYGISAGTSLEVNVNVGWGENGYDKIGIAPLYFVSTGYVYDSALESSRSSGHFWSSTVYSPNTAYNLRYVASALVPSDNGGRLVGRSVRCLAR